TEVEVCTTYILGSDRDLIPPLISSQMLSNDAQEKSRKQRRKAKREPSIVIRPALIIRSIPPCPVRQPPAVGRYSFPQKETGNCVVSPPVRDVSPCLKKGFSSPRATPCDA